MAKCKALTGSVVKWLRSTQLGHPSVDRCNKRAVMLCGWGVKAGMVREWMTGKTV